MLLLFFVAAAADVDIVAYVTEVAAAVEAVDGAVAFVVVVVAADVAVVAVVVVIFVFVFLPLFSIQQPSFQPVSHRTAVNPFPGIH